MDKMTQLNSAYAAGVSLWATGMAVLTETLVACYTSGDWSKFMFEDWKLFAFAAVFAGPVSFIMRMTGTAKPEPKVSEENEA